MKEILELVRIIEFLKEGRNDYSYVYAKLNNFPSIKEKYPNLDWSFLDYLEDKSKEEIKKWIDVCVKTVHIL